MSDSFEIFWNLYDNKKSKEKVERKWHLMTAKDQLACMDSLPSYIKSTPDRAYRKHPMTYLNQKCWNDTIYGEEKEKKEIYIQPKPKELSNYVAPVPSEASRKEFLANKIRQAYEGKINLNDIGSVYTNRLEKFFNTPFDVLEKIQLDVLELMSRKPKNRFEEIPEINWKLEVRNRILRYNMKTWREQNREIYKEI